MLNGVQGMVGETALVTKAIEGAHHPGRVRARGEEWQAISLDPDEVVPVGASVMVAGIERGLLVVYAMKAKGELTCLDRKRVFEVPMFASAGVFEVAGILVVAGLVLIGVVAARVRLRQDRPAGGASAW